MSFVRVRPLSLISLWSVLLVARGAHAEPPTSIGSIACPTRAITIPDSLAGRAEVSIDRAGQKLTVRVRALGGGNRVIEVATCEEAQAAAETVLALAASSSAPAPPVEPAPEPAKTATIVVSPPAVVPNERPPAASGSSSSTRLTPSLYAHAVADVGTLPGAAAGARAGASLNRGAFDVRLGGLGLFPRRSPGESAVDVGLLAVESRVCAASGARSSIRGGVCAGAEAGRLEASGVALRDAREASTFWAAVAVGPSLSFAFAGARLSAHAEAAAPLTRTTFYAAGTERELHRAAAVIGRASLGVEADLP